jgi:hypothetical protein
MGATHTQPGRAQCTAPPHKACARRPRWHGRWQTYGGRTWEGLEVKLHEATVHEPGNERLTDSQWLGMATGRATLTSGNGWCSGGGRQRSQGGAWLGPAQQWLHQEHATTQEGR